MDEEKSNKQASKFPSTTQSPAAADLDSAWTGHKSIWIQTRDDRDIGQMVLDLLPDAVIFMDREFHILWANQKALQDAGLQRHEMYGHICYKIRWGSDFPCSGCPCVSVVQSGRPNRSLIEDEQGRVWIRRAVPVLDQHETVKGVVEVSSEYDGILDDAGGVQALKNQSLENLTDVLGREFGQVLMGIIGNVHLAYLDLPARSAMRGYLENIEKGSQQALETLKCISTYPVLGKHLLQQLDLSLMMEKTTEALRKKLPAGVTVQCSFQKQLPLIEADGSQIRKMICCLVDNAIEALQDRGGVISLSTGLEQMIEDEPQNQTVYGFRPLDDVVCMKVSDTGCGMSQAVKARMFDPFFTTKKGARGLGLTMVFGIVRNLGGAIRVKSAEEAGSTFEILLQAKEPFEKKKVDHDV